MKKFKLILDHSRVFTDHFHWAHDCKASGRGPEMEDEQLLSVMMCPLRISPYGPRNYVVMGSPAVPGVLSTRFVGDVTLAGVAVN